ncbi:hypothetical protein C7M84_007859 [Penaeus vannamei]|uniref:Uncharacterized protein n=1 Tax=Penaeus vannamei TaxID=6689 RepID=A0A3R7M5T1_PENVA|nr:hypothetical protein C7M84_007859 [Penaeus vannamei]
MVNIPGDAEQSDTVTLEDFTDEFDERHGIGDFGYSCDDFDIFPSVSMDVCAVETPAGEGIIPKGNLEHLGSDADEDTAQELRENLRGARLTAKEAARRAQQGWARDYNRRVRQRFEPAVGDLVLLRNFSRPGGPARALGPRWSKPARIVKRIGPVNYMVSSLLIFINISFSVPLSFPLTFFHLHPPAFPSSLAVPTSLFLFPLSIPIFPFSLYTPFSPLPPSLPSSPLHPFPSPSFLSHPLHPCYSLPSIPLQPRYSLLSSTSSSSPLHPFPPPLSLPPTLLSPSPSSLHPSSPSPTPLLLLLSSPPSSPPTPLLLPPLLSLPLLLPHYTPIPPSSPPIPLLFLLSSSSLSPTTLSLLLLPPSLSPLHPFPSSPLHPHPYPSSTPPKPLPIPPPSPRNPLPSPLPPAPHLFQPIISS